MRKLKIMEHISLDGVIQSSGEDKFPYSDWTAPYRTPAGRDALLAAHGGRFDLLLGRRTYDMWSDSPKAPSSPMADGLNAAKKYVSTRRPESLEWGPFEGLGPDIVEGIRRIKSQDGRDLILWGSSTLTSTLIRAHQHANNADRHPPQSLQGRRAPEMQLHYCCTVISVPACVVKPLYIAIVGWSPLASEGGTTTLN
jgi:dihydrofolate reductase